jgi:hypothetical protein
VPDEEQAFVDPYGWDGRRWRWLPVSFPSSGVARIDLQPDTFMPLAVALTRATAGATQVAAVLLPPPNTVPAAVAELPILEMRAFHLESDDGSVAGSVFPVPARPEGRYAVIDNLESNRTRYDLITNILSRPESRENHRRAIVGIARDASLAGVVLDYRGVPGDLMPLYADWLTRLNHDLDHVGADLIVTVPMPRGEADQWDPSPYTWRPLGAAVDGLRVLLPDDKPPGIADLDGMVRWALQSVERQKLQLSVTARGRDILDDPGVTEVKPIGFGEALAKILDMAEADAPRRLSPAESATVELRTVAVSGLSRDPTTSQWQFAYWDGSRRPHTVWLNDASGLKPAFDIAARYRLGRLDLDGVSAGLDPSLWQLVQTFRDEGRAELDPKAYAYQLDWQLLDDTGAVVREAVQPVDATTFQFRAPEAEGSYRLSVDLVDGNGRLVAPGSTVPVTVGPPPLPTPSPTPLVVLIAPTPENPVTMPPPSDELAIHRDPILANVTAQAVVSDVYDASVIMPDSVLRAGPSTQTAVAGDIDVGDRLDVMGRSSDARWYWVRVAATGVTGWAYADVIELRVDGGSVPEILEPTPTP